MYATLFSSIYVNNNNVASNVQPMYSVALQAANIVLSVCLNIRILLAEEHLTIFLIIFAHFLIIILVIVSSSSSSSSRSILIDDYTCCSSNNNNNNNNNEII